MMTQLNDNHCPACGKPKTAGWFNPNTATVAAPSSRYSMQRSESLGHPLITLPMFGILPNAAAAVAQPTTMTYPAGDLCSCGVIKIA